MQFYQLHRIRSETRGAGRSDRYPRGILTDVTLNNGQRVEAAEDLAPLVDGESTTARAGQRAASYRGGTLAARSVTGALMGVAVGCLAGAIFSNAPDTQTSFYIGAGVALGLALVAGGTSIGLNAGALIATDESFESFDRDLQTQLRIRMNAPREELIDRGSSSSPRPVGEELIDTSTGATQHAAPTDAAAPDASAP